MGCNSLIFLYLCCLVAQHPTVRQRDQNSRVPRMYCLRYKLNSKERDTRERVFIGPRVKLNFNLLNTPKKLECIT